MFKSDNMLEMFILGLQRDVFCQACMRKSMHCFVRFLLALVEGPLMLAATSRCLYTCSFSCTVASVTYCSGYFAAEVRQRKESHTKPSIVKKRCIKLYSETLLSERYCIYTSSIHEQR
jgi:hypothetical protein